MRSIAQMEIQARCDRDEIRRLREENARLREYMRPDQIEEAETVTKLTRERDDARAEVKRSHNAILHLTAEVARLEGLVLSSCDGNQGATAVVSNASALWAEARRIRAQRELPYRSVSIEARREEGKA